MFISTTANTVRKKRFLSETNSRMASLRSGSSKGEFSAVVPSESILGTQQRCRVKGFSQGCAFGNVQQFLVWKQLEATGMGLGVLSSSLAKAVG